MPENHSLFTRRGSPAFQILRDLHLYLGLFISPFILLFACSVFFLVHAWLPTASNPSEPRIIADLPIPAGLEKLSGRERIDALRPVLDKSGIYGEVGWVQHQVRENRLILPVTVPGRVTTVTIDIPRREASVRDQATGLLDAFVFLHKNPGPHLVGMRMNWPWMKVWSWLADATVYFTMVVTTTGVYLVFLIRTQRRISFALLAAGAVTCFGLIYVIVH